MKPILLATLALLCFACQSDDFQSEERIIANTYPDVDQELWPYFDSFQLEANARGIQVDLSNRILSGAIDGIAADQVVGTCNYFSHRPNTVTIDKDFWKNSSANAREAVVFHELGHCVLTRDHRESTDNSGTCLSIMASGTQNCRLNYGSSTRTSYLDELFDPQFAGDWFN